MDESLTNTNLDKTVDFSYPEGFMEAASVLDFLPEEARAQMLSVFVQSGTQ
jgi:hypothetical protein